MSKGMKFQLVSRIDIELRPIYQIKVSKEKIARNEKTIKKFETATEDKDEFRKALDKIYEYIINDEI